MNDPHLLPHQIDLLVDGDAGFTARPMRAHVADCPDCRVRYELARRAADAVEALPHFSPRLPFADHVMRKVQVIEPWYVTLYESVLRFIPTRGPLRVLATVGTSAVAMAITLGGLWLATRWDFAAWGLNLALEQGRETLYLNVGSVASQALGADLVAQLASGDLWPVALAAGFLGLSLIAAALGLRRMAAAARANRS